MPSRSIRGQKQVADRSFIDRKIWEGPVSFREFHLVAKKASGAKTASAQLNEPVSLYADKGSEGIVDRDSGHAQQM